MYSVVFIALRIGFILMTTMEQEALLMDENYLAASAMTIGIRLVVNAD